MCTAAHFFMAMGSAAFSPATPHPAAAATRARSVRMAAAVDTGGAAIVVKGVDVWAGDSPLILDVNWSVMPNERWAIHGTNGCGKSTLLRAISAAANGGGGGRLADGGQLVVSSSLRLGMLEQTAVSGADTTVRE